MTTIIRPWSPHEPRPANLVILGPTPVDTLRSVEDRLRWAAARIAIQRHVLRSTTHADQVIWHAAARRALAETRVQYRALLKARRAVRQLVERDADRVDAAVNGNG